jgi:hypothetical protein
MADAEIRSDDGDERWGENECIDYFVEEEEEESDDDDDDNDDSISDDEVIEDEILEQFIRTFSIGDYIEFDNTLCLDRSVISSAQSTQALYDKPNNWVQRNQIGLEKVKEQLQLQTCIHSVSHDKTFNLKLMHNSHEDQQLTDGEEPIVWNEKILDEYLDQLEAKMNEVDIVIIIHDIHF